jgi:DegV family protein with EDD domain
MSFIALVTDSTAGLPSDYVKEHDIRVVPLYLNMDNTTYRDGVDITPQEFYERLPTCTPLPTTSQPSAGDFEMVYRQAVKDGASAIISIHLSSGISGTINSAQLAAEQVGDVPIEIIDTQAAATAQAFGLQAAVSALKGGADLASAVAAIRRVVDAQRVIFTVDTLEYLYKGGRIGGAAALVGSLLQFKPVLHFKDGKIDALERVRKSSRSIARLAEIMQEAYGSSEPLRVLILQAACADRAEALQKILHERLNVIDVMIMPLTPVLGAHCGNGTLGLACCPQAAFPPDGK